MAVYRNGLERMQDEWKTFKAKTFREKVRHIITYEKHLLLILAVLVLAGFYGYDFIPIHNNNIKRSYLLHQPKKNLSNKWVFQELYQNIENLYQLYKESVWMM